MSEIQVKRTVANRDQLLKVVDTTFNTFTEETNQDTLSVDDFFSEYDRLFLDIPISGETNSHEYLATRSSELANLDQISQDIQPLLDEIANLRERLIEANLTIASLQVSS